MKTWADIGFEIEPTKDGSPTLRLLESIDPAKDRGESMHHSGGACKETQLIYGNPIQSILENIEKPHFLIVGLGLGYIEMVIAQRALALKMKPQDIGLISNCESIPELRDFFFNWLQEEQNSLSTEVWNVYDQAADFVCEGTSVSKQDIREFLKYHFSNKDHLGGALLEQPELPSRYHCILYDAFSAKTTPYLWEEDYLLQFMKKFTQEKCLFSTYASRVSLKNALNKANFEVINRAGFVGKRGSTLGVRNVPPGTYFPSLIHSQS